VAAVVISLICRRGMMMKTVIKVKKEVDIRFVKININIRYLGDGDDDDVSPSFPLIQGNTWKATINVDTGVIEGWPQGVSENLFTFVRCLQKVFAR